MSDITIELATGNSKELYESLTKLIPQISSRLALISYEQLTEILSAKNHYLLVARQKNTDNIIGSITLVLYRTLSGLHAHFEDFVVDQSQRGKGIGKMLLQNAIEKARENGATFIDLSSRPDRIIANKLYQNLGFEKRITNVYRHTVKKP